MEIRKETMATFDVEAFEAVYGKLRTRMLPHELEPPWLRHHDHDQALATSIWYAVDLVLRAGLNQVDWSNELRLKRKEAETLWHRGRLAGSPAGETDAHHDDAGRLILSGRTTLRLAQALAAAEPGPVTAFMSSQRELAPIGLPFGVYLDDADRAIAIITRWIKGPGTGTGTARSLEFSTGLEDQMSQPVVTLWEHGLECIRMTRAASRRDKGQATPRPQQ